MLLFAVGLFLGQTGKKGRLTLHSSGQGSTAVVLENIYGSRPLRHHDFTVGPLSIYPSASGGFNESCLE
jgi:hypothetical protein